MSHRRKSARPTNKHWRNETRCEHTFEHSPRSSLEDDVDPPPPYPGSIFTRSVPGSTVPGSTVPVPAISGPTVLVPAISGSTVPGPAISVSTVPGPAIEIPPDIFEDFEQLKQATQMDTSALMRNLLKDYHRDPSRSTLQWAKVDQDEEKAVLDDKQAMRELPKNNNVHHRTRLLDTGCESLPQLPRGTEEPLDLSLDVKTYPTMCRAVDNSSIALSGGRLHLRPVSNTGTPGATPVGQQTLATTLNLTPICTQGGMVMAANMPTHCSLVMSSAVPGCETFTTSNGTGEGSIMMPVQMSMHLPTVTAVDGEKNIMTSAISVDGQNYPPPGSIFAIIQAVAGNMPAVSVKAIPQPVQSIAVTQGAVTQAAPVTAPPPPAPVPPQQQVPARRGRKPGSINKRTKVNKPAKSNEMKIISENTIFPGVYTSILKLPWSRRSRTKSNPPTPAAQRQTQATTNILSGNAPGATSSSVATTGPSPSTTQSVMMVYPNATISALGKPVRKRGRPPKLPVLSHLLSEKKAKDLPSGQVNQSASLSADGSMLSILNTHSIGAEAASDIDQPKKVKIVFETQDLSSSEVAPSQPAPELHYDDPSGHDATNVDSNGSMFQEMLLSSKSLINVKPRKRQSISYLKSGDNFICTTFRIKPQDSRNKGADDDPAQGLPVHAPIQTASVDTFSKDNMDPTFSASTESTDSVTMSPTPSMEGLPSSNNMFHELHHCKVCNEIVPAEEKLAHKQQHILATSFCMTCGSEYNSYHVGNTGEDVATPHNFQCEQCSESHKSSLSLTAALQVKRKSYQCDLCSHQFQTFSDYCEHRRKSHADENIAVDYSCDKCGKMFFTEKSLDIHKVTHSTKAVRCLLDDCPTMSVDEDGLDEHMKEFHKKDYTCVYDDCKKKFMKRFHLQEHVRVKHFNIRAYQCSWPGCFKEFAAERHLKVHLLIHKDEKPLKCDFCEYRCRQRNAMNWHMRKHPEAPYRYRKFGMLSGGDD